MFVRLFMINIIVGCIHAHGFRVLSTSSHQYPRPTFSENSKWPIEVTTRFSNSLNCTAAAALIANIHEFHYFFAEFRRSCVFTCIYYAHRLLRTMANGNGSERTANDRTKRNNERKWGKINGIENCLEYKLFYAPFVSSTGLRIERNRFLFLFFFCSIGR